MWRPLGLLGLLLVPPLAAALAGAPGPRTLRLNLGPGDGPFIDGFEGAYDVVNGRALQWSHRQARIDLPLDYEGPAQLALRFGPPRGGAEARVDLVLASKPLAGFTCCSPPAFERRRMEANAARRTPIQLELRITRPDDERLGLLMDWVQVEVGKGGRVWPRGSALARPLALLVAAFFVLLVAGFGAPAAAALLSPLSLLLAVGLGRDPWLVHRLLTWLPEGLLLLGLPLGLFARGCARRGWLESGEARRAAALTAAVFVLRAAAVNHPDFYHPDLMSHARRVQSLRAAGAEAFFQPVRALGLESPPEGASGRTRIGLYYYRIGGRLLPLPYTLLPYVPVALLDLDYDRTLTALRLLGAAASALPVMLLALLARALGAPGWAPLLLAAAPTPAVELFLASVPALVGHVFDLAWLVVLARALVDLPRRRCLLAAGAALAAAQLVYVSSPITTVFLVLALAALAPAVPGLRPGTGRAALLVLAIGSALSVALYYRHFLPSAWEAVRAAAQAAPGSAPASVLGAGRLDGSLLAFALPVVAVFAAFGASRLSAARPAAAAFLAGSFLSLLLVALLRLRLPVVFGYVHLALFATPLFCLTAAAGLRAAFGRGSRPWLVPAVAALVGLQGLFWQGRAFWSALGRAR